MESADLPEPAFRPARPGVSGYDRGQVDDFVARVRAALGPAGDGMAPYEVTDQRFAVRRWRQGYRLREVDDYLDRAEELLRRRHGDDAVADIAGTGSTPRHPATWWVYAVAALLVAAIAVVVVVSVR